MGTRIAVMKDGILQQLDSPQVLYDNPSNMFVAGFIGSPSMNFFEAKLDRKDGGAVVDMGAFALPLPSEAKRINLHSLQSAWLILAVQIAVQLCGCPYYCDYFCHRYPPHSPGFCHYRHHLIECDIA